MSSEQFIADMKSAVNARTIFGEPIRVDGVTLIPATAVRGGMGSGGARGGEGFGLKARPVGMYALRDGRLSWRPAVDVNRIIWGGQLVTLVIAVSALLRSLSPGRRTLAWSGLFALPARFSKRRRRLPWH